MMLGDAVITLSSIELSHWCLISGLNLVLQAVDDQCVGLENEPLQDGELGQRHSGQAKVVEEILLSAKSARS